MEFTSVAIKKLRSKLRMTQVQFAKAIGVSERTVIHWENGTRGVSRLAQNAIERTAKEATNG